MYGHAFGILPRPRAAGCVTLFDAATANLLYKFVTDITFNDEKEYNKRLEDEENK